MRRIRDRIEELFDLSLDPGGRATRPAR